MPIGVFRFSGDQVRFSGAGRWSDSPMFSWNGKPTAGVALPDQPSSERKGEL
jgi:hypothetical protein